MKDDVRALVALSASLAARDGSLESAMRTAAAACDPAAVEEALIQSYLFLGYPAALNAFALWRRVSGRPAGPATVETVDRAERGAEVCGLVYGGQYGRLRENVRRLHPDMERWMVEEGYGKVLGRPGLSLPVRELCIVALLAVQDAPRQLYSHLRGALNVGCDAATVEAALAEALERAGPEPRRRAEAKWSRLRARRGVEGRSPSEEEGSA